MVSLLQAFLMAVGVAALVLASVLIGGFIVFRCKSAPGESFIGREPKGAVFTIPDVASEDVEAADNDQEKKLMANTERFLSLLGGKG